MELALKKVSFSEALSEESNAFTADVLVDGVLVATARNRGHGGGTDVQPFFSGNSDEKRRTQMKANRLVMAQYEAWAAQQPNWGVGESQVSPGGFARSLADDVDAAFELWLQAHYAKKDQDRMKRLCGKQWVFSLKERDGKPVEANVIFTMPRLPQHSLATVGKHLRQKHGDNLKQFYNEIYG